MSRIAAAGSFSPPAFAKPTVAVQVNVTVPQPHAATPPADLWTILNRVAIVATIVGTAVAILAVG